MKESRLAALVFVVLGALAVFGIVQMRRAAKSAPASASADAGRDDAVP